MNRFGFNRIIDDVLRIDDGERIERNLGRKSAVLVIQEIENGGFDHRASSEACEKWSYFVGGSNRF